MRSLRGVCGRVFSRGGIIATVALFVAATFAANYIEHRTPWFAQHSQIKEPPPNPPVVKGRDPSPPKETPPSPPAPVHVSPSSIPTADQRPIDPQRKYIVAARLKVPSEPGARITVPGGISRLSRVSLSEGRFDLSATEDMYFRPSPESSQEILLCHYEGVDPGWYGFGVEKGGKYADGLTVDGVPERNFRFTPQSDRPEEFLLSTGKR